MVHHTADPEVDWADTVLGTDSYAHGGSSSLRSEVDAYFYDMSAASYSSIMTFWQVSDTIFLLLVFTYSF